VIGLVWLTLLLGLTVVVWCVLAPREIGKEDEPLTRVRVRMPDVEGWALRMSQHNARPRRSAAPAPVPPPVVEEPVLMETPAAGETSVAAEALIEAEPLSAMGAPQPVLTEEPLSPFALPGA
jgi:hypothetical protein